MTMSCITLFAQEAAMTTNQLVRVAGHAVCAPWWVEPKAEHAALRMSWVVVTDENGKRSLRSRWNLADEMSKHKQRQ
jgi:hypothetical protein